MVPSCSHHGGKTPAQAARSSNSACLAKLGFTVGNLGQPKEHGTLSFQDVTGPSARLAKLGLKTLASANILVNLWNGGCYLRMTPGPESNPHVEPRVHTEHGPAIVTMMLAHLKFRGFCRQASQNQHVPVPRATTQARSSSRIAARGAATAFNLAGLEGLGCWA